MSQIIESLDNRFTYDPDEGILRWANGPNAGSVAGYLDDKGYRRVNLNGKLKYAHRIIYKIMTGNWPDIIDHIDCDPNNNKWNNLKSVTIGVNNTNKKYGRPVCGVYERPNGTFRVKYKSKDLGTYKSEARAISVRRQAEIDDGL